MRKFRVLGICVFLLLWFSGCDETETGIVMAEEVPGWTNLFDGHSLEGWEKANFGGQGEVSVEDGIIYMNWGETLTGITWTGEFPELDYEISLEAMKIQGNDFFCGLTFPIDGYNATLILGGWGGTVTGISSIMTLDASENETTTMRKYEKNQWYRIKLRVTGERLTAWLDDEVIVDMDTEGAEFDIRPEVSLSVPLGIACFQTTTALKNIRYRKIGK